MRTAAEGPVEILLVEDSPTDRLMAIEALESAKLLNGLNVVENGEEAMAYLRREGKYREARRPALILLDLNMPKKDGREVLAELKSDPLLKHIPVIVMTTSAAEEDVIRAYGYHANSYITKPVNFERFSEAIKCLGCCWFEIVTLPPANHSENPSRSQSKQLRNQSRESSQVVRVLLIEDNPSDALILTEALGSDPARRFVISKASRIAQARELLEQEAFDIVITDLGLPDGQGLDTYRQVRAFALHLPVIVLTGDLDEELGMSCLHEGAQDYLVKGQLSSHALARALRYAIEKKSIEEQLRQSQRLDAVGQLAGGIAHDFNNLLTIIHGHALQLSISHVPSLEVADSAKEILEATERAAGLTRQLLTFSRRQKIQLKPIDLNQVVGDFVRIFRRILGEGVHLELVLCPASVPVMADLGMLEQILLNLAVNAKDAMPNGGKLTLRTSIKELGLDDTDSRDFVRGFASLEVRDTGMGISPDDLPWIFDPFYTTKDVGSGTGLGLATVYSIAQQHNGRIEVASEVGSGTCFELVIPMTDKPLEDLSRLIETMAPVSPTPDLPRPVTILLVEDEDPLRALARRYLVKCGYSVLEACTGQQARDVFAERAPEIDLLLTDMMMPGGVSGRQLGEEFNAINPDLQVIYTSGYSVEFSSTDFHLEEGVNFLQKPFSLSSLSGVVKARLQDNSSQNRA